MCTVRIIESRQLQARSLLYTSLFYSYYVSPHAFGVLYVSPLPGLTIEFNLATYTVNEGGVATLRIVKIGEADYPVSVNLSTVDGSAVGEFIDIIGGEGKLIFGRYCDARNICKSGIMRKNAQICSIITLELQ